ncbi:MAG: class I SAM-dependent methyltransferase [Deltaproteobacteria bacterium]|nr:class I SAM-dependent methyltransferase [Deltaproteobacteria bacterium]
MEATRHDYAAQAARYDRTRAASPDLVALLAQAVAGEPGPRLVDVGGGTGNYAAALRQRGFAPLVIDRAPAMLARARDKGLACLRGDATALPVATASADVVMSISMLHLVPDWRAMLRELRRVLRPGGRGALMLYTRENLGVHWVFDYFPSTRAWVEDWHGPLAEVLAELPGARVVPLRFSDGSDGSLAALCRTPARLLDPAARAQTSYFEKLETEAPAVLAAGLAALRRDLDGGRRPDVEVAAVREKVGDGTVIMWTA